MAYTRVNWINEQEGTTTPLNATNLNTMDAGIADVDERVTTLENTPTQADAYKTIVVGDDSLVASGADSVEFVAGDNVTLTVDEENKQITIASSGGSGGSGHEMLSTVEDVEAVTSSSDNHVVSAYVIKNYANRHTESVISTLTANNNTITITNDVFKDDNATYEFLFEPTQNSSGDYEVLTLSSYTLNTTTGVIALTVTDAPTVNTRVRIDVTTYRA